MFILFKNELTTSAPNIYETPLSFSYHPLLSIPGSLHSKSHSNPSSGTSRGLFIFETSENSVNYGESPPCMHKIFSSIVARIGK